jgi:hypothetical protein
MGLSNNNSWGFCTRATLGVVMFMITNASREKCHDQACTVATQSPVLAIQYANTDFRLGYNLSLGDDGKTEDKESPSGRDSTRADHINHGIEQAIPRLDWNTINENDYPIFDHQQRPFVRNDDRRMAGCVACSK